MVFFFIFLLFHIKPLGRVGEPPPLGHKIHLQGGEMINEVLPQKLLSLNFLYL